MKIRSLSVNQFKKFTSPQVLDGITDELNIVVGPNELGKSTLLDALRAVLFERYGSKAQVIQNLQNDRSLAAPVVELVFDIDGGEYTLTKRFMKREFAQLQCPDGTLLEADAAEAELRRLLGFKEAGSRGSNSESLGMWGVLWVLQGESFGRPELTNSAQASLSAGLESEVGEVLGGRRGRELPQAIEQAMGELVTSQLKRPRGRYKEAQDRVAELEQMMDSQQQQQRELGETIEQLGAAEDRLRTLESGDQDQQYREDIIKTRAELKEVEQHQLQINAAQSELDNRSRQLVQAQDALRQRARGRAELAAAQDELTESSRVLADLRDRETEAQQRLDPLRQELQATETRSSDAEREEAYWRNAATVVARTAELDSLRRRQREIDDALERLAAVRRAVAENNVDDQLMQRVRDAATALDRATARLSGAATVVRFDFSPDRMAGVEVDGNPLSNPLAVVEATEPTVISIPDRGQIVIDPALAEGAQLRAQQREAETALNEALSEAAAESVAAAQLRRDERRSLEARVEAAREEVVRLGADREDVAEQLNALEGWQRTLEPEWRDLQSHDRDEAERMLHDAQDELNRCRDAYRLAQLALDQRRESVDTLSGEVREQQGTVDLATELLTRRQTAFATEVAETPDLELEANVRDAEAAVSDQQREIDTLQADLPPSSAELLQARIDRREEAIKAHNNRRSDLGAEISRLQGIIEAQEGAGIGETIEHTERELDRARDRHDRFEREVAVLDLLSTTLHEAESEANERYLAPVRSRVHPYLQMLFPNSEISLDENFNIVGVSRQRDYEERFDRLSIGTQEQIAVLVRLAFAEMLVDQGAPAAVILDDALVFSDDRRLQLMFDILAYAAKRVQIIVFTCREQLFEGLGANQLQLRPGNPDLLRSA